MFARPQRALSSLSRWVRRVVAVAVSAVFCVTLLGSPVSAAPAAPSAPAAPPGIPLADLHQRAAEVQQQYAAATEVYEIARRHVAEARTVAEQARSTEDAARAERDAAREQLGTYVASLYRMGIEDQHPMLAIVVYGPESASEILHDQQVAAIVGNQQGQVLQRAQEASARAEVASVAAQQAEDAAEDAQEQAQALLDQAQDEMSSAMTALNAILSSLGLGSSTGGLVSYQWPLAGSPGVTAEFGSIDSAHPTPHDGVDFGVPLGTPVVAVADGVVQVAGDTGNGFGTHIQILHADGLMSLYGHMEAGSTPADVMVGAIVRRGQVIGTVGSTGQSTGPHLHLGFYTSFPTTRVDARQVLPAMPIG